MSDAIVSPKISLPATNAGLYGGLADVALEIWSGEDQTGLTVSASSTPSQTLTLDASATGLHGAVGEGEVTLSAGATGAGLAGGYANVSIGLGVSAVGYGPSSASVTLSADADATGLHGGVATASLGLRWAVSVASTSSESVADVAVALGLHAQATGLAGGNAAVAANLGLDLDATGIAGSVGTGAVDLGWSMAATGYSVGTAEVSATLTWSMPVGATGWGPLHDVPDDFALVMNAANKAVSTYASFPFDSLTFFAGTLIGAHSGGIASIDAQTDDDADIEAIVQTGMLNGEMEGQFRPLAAHLEYRSAGPLRFTVIPDESGDEYEYHLDEARSGGVYRSRVKFGKGLRCSRMAIRIANLDGADFALNLLELDLSGTTRRTS